jgi:hypothetical protein
MTTTMTATKTAAVRASLLKLASLTIFSLLLQSFTISHDKSSPLFASAQSCSVSESERDPALHEMTYDIGNGPQKTWVYIEPDVTTFYQLEDPPAKTKVVPKFNGFQGKFINLSNQPASLYW